MESLEKIVAENLKRLRGERKLSLDRVSALTGVSKSML
ncbi:MAG: DNA-binding protein, partial [Synergistaceae bacterium]|nr:DNA-binding protein [Synergistaceae bacterium]